MAYTSPYQTAPTPGGVPLPGADTFAMNNGTAPYASASSDANFARTQQADNFQQGLGEFGQFVNEFLPQAGGGTTASSSGAGVGPSGGQLLTGGTWTPTVAAPSSAAPAQISFSATPQSTAGPAFANAKAQVGTSLLGLQKALQASMAGRNLSGSTAETNAEGNILLGGEQQLGNVATQSAITDANTANQMANEAYQGAITQRGQDLTADTAANQEALTARGQNISANEAAVNEQLARDQFNYTQTQDRLKSIAGLYSAFQSGLGRGLY